jgi:hypothetical protein
MIEDVLRDLGYTSFALASSRQGALAAAAFVFSLQAFHVERCEARVRFGYSGMFNSVRKVPLP